MTDGLSDIYHSDKEEERDSYRVRLFSAGQLEKKFLKGVNNNNFKDDNQYILSGAERAQLIAILYEYKKYVQKELDRI